MAPMTEELLIALRDFFAAANAGELKQAYTALTAITPKSAPAVADWRAVEFAFNRLFVGPKALIAPPYASVYLDPEPQLMGQSTLTIRTLWRLLDRALPWQNAIPDDHLSFELDAYRQLYMATKSVSSPELESARHFLLDHLARWTPIFVGRIHTDPDLPLAIAFVADCLNEWLAVEVAMQMQYRPVIYTN